LTHDDKGELSTPRRLAAAGGITVSDRSTASAPLGHLGAADRLMEKHPLLGVPLPAYGGRSLPNLAGTLAQALGRDAAETLPLPPLAADVDPLKGRAPEGPVVVLLVDALGWRALEGSAERHPEGTAAGWAGRARPITSVFPTTTTVALTSLGTGASPGQHGVVGHRVYLPHFGTVVELLRMSPLGVHGSETLVGPDWSPSLVSGVRTVFRRGVPGLAVSRARFEGTGFTRMIYDGADYVPFSTISDFALTLVDLLSRPNPSPLVYAYWDDLDLAEHSRGPDPRLVDLELERVGSILSFVARHLDRRTVAATQFVLTGDHGQVPLDAQRQLVVDQDPELLSLLSRPPSGDRRATYFSARSGNLGALRAALTDRLPPGGRLLEMPDSVDAGLFGPAPRHPELPDRVGDLLVLLPSPGGVNYTVPGGRARSHPMRGAHGGLEADELLIPLVSGTAEELAHPSRPGPHVSSAHRRGRSR